MSAMMSEPAQPRWKTPELAIIAGCLIALIGFGVRSGFGFFLEPMTADLGWDRQTYGLAMAIQNIAWGIGVPVAGIFADRFGPTRVLIVGAVIYFAGIIGMADATSPLGLHLTGGALTGLGVAFTAFSLALAAMAKVVARERRPVVLGLGMAATSVGQVIFSPITQGFIQSYGWSATLVLLAAAALAIMPLAWALPVGAVTDEPETAEQTTGEAISEAMGHRGYVLLTVGFFVCGFHVTFIGIHLPAYVSDLGLAPYVAAASLSLIGLFNIIGSFAAGLFGTYCSKKNSLSVIYFLRAVTITALMFAPKTEVNVLLFAGAMGLLWLSTVPLTTAIVGQIFGVRYLATLFGFVFLSHQAGSFLGVWLGGYLYDVYGSYDAVWWAGVALGLFAAVVHLPINEKPLVRTAAPA